MDPFTVVVGVLGTLDASTRLASKAANIVATLKNAPGDILALVNELEDLRVVLNEADTARERLEHATQGSASLLSALRMELETARFEVDELEIILDKTWSLKMQKRIMWLRKQGDIEKRRARLRACRERLRDLLVTHNVYVTIHLTTIIDFLTFIFCSISGSRIELELSTVQATLELHRTETSETLAEIRTTSKLIQKELEATRLPHETPLSPPPSYTPESSFITPNPPPYPIKDWQAEDDAPNALSPALALAQKVALVKKLESLSIGGGIDTPTNAPKEVTSISKSSLDNLLNVPTVSFRVSKRTSCPSKCWCQCHSSPCQLPLNFRLKMAAPAMKFLSGSLFMSYAGNPLMTRPCNSQSCQDRRRTRFQATYTFPSWLLRYSLEFYYERYGSGRPNMGMKVRNRVDIFPREGQSLLAASCSGSAELVLKILQSNPYQMHDVTVIDGGPPLLQSVRAGHTAVSKLLLAAGADPDEQDDHGTSSRMELARNSLMRNEDLHSGIRGLFDIWGFIQDSFFPIITKSVLRFPGAPPLEEFDERTIPDLKSAANARDDLEWQPLHWAVARGDVAAAKILLRMGADPNSTNGIMKRTALHLAGLNNNSAGIISHLVRHGAVPTRDINRRSPIDHAAYYGSLDSLKAMVESGVDPIYRERVNSSSMYCAAFTGQAEAIRYLLSLGDPILSSTELRDIDGETVVVAPVYGNKPHILDLLLSAGADPGVVANDGTSLFMLAAMHGSLEVMKVLAKHDLSRVDICQENEEGWTAKQLFARRLDATEELKECFQGIASALEEKRLTCNGEECDDEGVSLTDDESDDEFEDANEEFS